MKSTPLKPPATLLAVAALASVLLAPPCFAAAEKPAHDKPGAVKPLPAIAKAVARLEKRAGLVTFYLDRRQGKLWLAVPPAREGNGEVASYIYQEAITTGLGSNPVGLDRGQLGDARIVTLRRIGGRGLVEAPNFKFRALSADAAERQAVRESFAPSILWAGEVEAEDRDG